MGSLTTSLLPTSRARLVTRDSIYYYRLSNAKTCLCEDTATDNFLWTWVNTDASSIRYLSSVVSAIIKKSTYQVLVTHCFDIFFRFYLGVFNGHLGLKMMIIMASL